MAEVLGIEIESESVKTVINYCRKIYSNNDKEDIVEEDIIMEWGNRW